MVYNVKASLTKQHVCFISRTFFFFIWSYNLDGRKKKMGLQKKDEYFILPKYEYFIELKIKMFYWH